MNLKSRISEALQIRSVGSAGDSPDSEALMLKRQQEEERQRAYMRRLLVTRNRELDELRKIMRQRRQRKDGTQVSSRGKGSGSASAGITRPPSPTDGAQLVSLINELEVKVLSEPMALTGLPRSDARPSVAANGEVRRPPETSSTPANPLDDVALMVAARRWDHAADLLIKAICAGDMRKGAVDWAMRSAIDLFERSGQIERTAAMRLQYQESRGREPSRILPPRLNAPKTGQLQTSNPIIWSCPAQLDKAAAAALGMILNTSKRNSPLVIDWTAAVGIDPTGMEGLQLCFEQAIRSQNIFVHFGLSKLIRVLRHELHNQAYTREAWKLWLTLLNWTGFRHAHHTAAAAYSRRYSDEAPRFQSVRCICQSLNLPPGGSMEGLVCAARFQGDLTGDDVEELDRLEILAPLPGRLVLLDFRLLTSVDFFFGADLLNWVIRRHSRGETVVIAYAHPLLSHFLQMLGLQHHAKLLGPLAAGLPK